MTQNSGNNLIYLNNAATSFPKPQEVITAVTTYLTSVPINPARAGFEVQDEDVISICRQKLAAFFKAEHPHQIIFTSGATESLNLAINGLDLDNDHVITTAIEHNSVLRPLKTLERQNKISLTIVDCDTHGWVDPEDIARHLRPNTKAVIVNHCSNVTGAILDLKSIADITHANDSLFIVDCSQSAGTLPIDVTGSGIDVMAFTGHKSLFGLPGIGGVYIREGLKLRPLKVGGTGVKSILLYQPEELPLYYESGTLNLPGIISLQAGLEFIANTGLAEIDGKKRADLRQLTAALQEIPKVIVYGSDNIDNRSSVFCFNIEGVSPADVGYILESSFGILVRAGLHCAPLIHQAMGAYPHGSVRVSPSYFTTAGELDYFIEAIKEISANTTYYESY